MKAQRRTRLLAFTAVAVLLCGAAYEQSAAATPGERALAPAKVTKTVASPQLPSIGRQPEATPAQTAATATCTATEILATGEKKGIDPKLKKLEAKLTKPPFTAWDTFTLLAESVVRAAKDRPATQKLATGGAITLVFKDKLVSPGGKPRLRLSVDMDSASGTRTVSTVIVFDSGDSVLFAGEPFGKGTYIFALSCTAP